MGKRWRRPCCRWTVARAPVRNDQEPVDDVRRRVFDVTPASLVTVSITVRGLLKSESAGRAVR